jgi:hypothetical protein
LFLGTAADRALHIVAPVSVHIGDELLGDHLDRFSFRNHDLVVPQWGTGQLFGSPMLSMTMDTPEVLPCFGSLVAASAVANSMRNSSLFFSGASETLKTQLC